MGRISRGWQLTKMSLRVVRKDKEILLFPFLSIVATLLILASFSLGIFMNGDLGKEVRDDPWLFSAFWGIFYFVAFFIAVFFNAAVIGCATIRMEGGDPTVGDGLRTAFENLKGIFMWALFAATIGMILRMLQEKTGIIGRFVFGALGMAFTIASYFAVPVLIYEKVGPLKALSRSVSILKSTWGEALVGNLGLGAIFILLALPAFLPIIVGLALMNLSALLIGLVVAAVYLLILGLVLSAAQSVLLAALYRYAKTGKISEEFAGLSFGNPFA